MVPGPTRQFFETKIDIVSALIADMRKRIAGSWWDFWNGGMSDPIVLQLVVDEAEVVVVAEAEDRRLRHMLPAQTHRLSQSLHKNNGRFSLR